MTSTLALTPPPRARPTTLRAAAPALFALTLTMLVEMVDNSVLNVALPTIGRDLEAGATGLQWIVGAYSLTFGGLLMVGGTLGDRFGRRRALLWGLVGFGAVSSLVPLVTTTWQLILIRAASGVFAALVTPGTMSLCFRLFDDDRLRRRAIGLIISVAMIGFAIGPVLSGLAVEHLPWQVLLVVNAPVAAIAWAGVRHGIAPDDPSDLRPGTTDVTGAALSVVGIGLALFTLTLGAEDGWWTTSTLAYGAAALVALLGFVVRERRASDPMLDLSLFGRPAVRSSAVLQTGVMVAMVGVGFASTQVFQFAWGWTPLQSGLGTLPLVAGMLTAGPLVDHAVDRCGRHRTSLLGSCLLVVSLLILIEALGTGFWVFAVGMFVLAVGMRAVMTTAAVTLMDALPDDHTSMGSAMNDTAQELGNAVGVAVVGTVVAVVMGNAMPVGAWSAAASGEFLHALRFAFGILAGLVVVITVAAACLARTPDSSGSDGAS